MMEVKAKLPDLHAGLSPGKVFLIIIWGLDLLHSNKVVPSFWQEVKSTVPDEASLLVLSSLAAAVDVVSAESWSYCYSVFSQLKPYTH